jgi:hypothetical protein
MSKSHGSAVYTRNIQNVRVPLQLIDVDPDKVKLDTTNPRVSFSMSQLTKAERTDPAATLLLTSQEDTEGLMRSIVISGGVQEPIYLRHDFTVAEGNRRVVAMRAAKEEHPTDPRFKRMPAWLIPKGTPENTIQDLLNEIHLGSVRGWAPYEKALQMRGLIKSGLVPEEVAERYRMTSKEVIAQIAAADMMDRQFFPITADPRDPQHRAKFSYFLEFLKNGRLQAHCKSIKDLPSRFSRWVRDEKIPTGAKVRRLPKILDAEEAIKLLDVSGFEAADQYISKQNPKEQELYLVLERARTRLQDMPLNELTELAFSDDRMSILRDLQSQIEKTLEGVTRLAGRSHTKARYRNSVARKTPSVKKGKRRA